MIDEKYKPVLKKIQKQLDEMCPSPEDEVTKLSNLYHKFLKADQRISRIAGIVLEIDEIIRQIRWHYGQALLMLEIYPEINKYNLRSEKEDDDFNELPNTILLGLRQFIKYSNEVLFDNFEKSWFSGTPSGWIFQMMIDNSMIRLIAAFDRIALLLFTVSNIEINKVYFRSGKLNLLHKKLNLPETQKLLNISESDVFNEFFIKYRDNLVHTKINYSRMSGTVPVNAYVKDDKLFSDDEFPWDAEILPKLVNAGYKTLLDAFSLSVEIIVKIEK